MVAVVGWLPATIRICIPSAQISGGLTEFAYLPKVSRNSVPEVACAFMEKMLSRVIMIK